MVVLDNYGKIEKPIIPDKSKLYIDKLVSGNQKMYKTSGLFEVTWTSLISDYESLMLLADDYHL